MKRALSLSLTAACIRVARKRYGGNMCALERGSGVSHGGFNRARMGARELSLNNLVRIAKGLGMLPSDLLREAEAYVSEVELRRAVVAEREAAE